MAYYGRQGLDTPIAMNLLAETVIRVTGSRSEIVHEALPVDDLQLVDPDITRAKEILGWKPEIELEGLRRMLPSLGREQVSG
jgi:dTDP-glucose 4,6-dehydratase